MSMAMPRLILPRPRLVELEEKKREKRERRDALEYDVRRCFHVEPLLLRLLRAELAVVVLY